MTMTVSNYFEVQEAFKRPTVDSRFGGSVCAIPSDASVIQLLGGEMYEGLTFTTDQMRRLERFYGFDFKKARKEAAAYAQEAYEAQVKAHEEMLADPEIRDWQKEQARAPTPPHPNVGMLNEAGSQRNMFRCVRMDGMRLMAAMSSYLEDGQDPVKLLLQLMIDAGYDVPSDVDWANDGQVVVVDPA